MATDSYVRGVLTVIAAALVYLCVVLTPWPAVQAQTAQRPGESTGPAEVVIVGWRGAAMPIETRRPLQVQGTVQVEQDQIRSTPLRVVLSGWELRESSGALPRVETFTPRTALPVATR
ncbi:MAG: hypothetical protein AB7O67_21670 [Vicinamibacterales bacterium]